MRESEKMQRLAQRIHALEMAHAEVVDARTELHTAHTRRARLSAELRASGLSLHRIAAVAGVTAPTVAKWISHAHKYPPRTSSRGCNQLAIQLPGLGLGEKADASYRARNGHAREGAK